MKKFAIVATLTWAIAPLSAQILITQSFNVNANIPDGSFSGLANQQTIATGLGAIQDVNVTLTLSGTGFGAFNGDFYAYLSHGGQTAVLLNRPGRRAGYPAGYGDNGFSSVTFDDSAANGDVHTYRLQLSGSDATAISGSGALTGSWAPDGRYVSPGLSLDSTPRTHGLSGFNGQSPDGQWTLFIADAASGGTARLDSWSVEMTVVPEPHETALAAGAALAIFALWRRASKKTA